METIQAYKAADGRVFTDRSECERYERDVFFEKKKGALHRRINLTCEHVSKLHNDLVELRKGYFDASKLRALELEVGNISRSLELFSRDVFEVSDLKDMQGGFIDLGRGAYQEPQPKGRGPAEDRSEW